MSSYGSATPFLVLVVALTAPLLSAAAENAEGDLAVRLHASDASAFLAKRLVFWRKFLLMQEAAASGLAMDTRVARGGACVWQVAAVGVVKAQAINIPAVALAE